MTQKKFNREDKVCGSITGRYLGKVLSCRDERVTIEACDGAIIEMPPLLVSKIPEYVNPGIKRIWVA